MSFVYDAAGNRSQRTDYNNAVTNYTSDALNRLTNISYPDLTAATYGYDELSRLTTATNPTGTVTIGYDNRSRVSSVTDVFGQVVSYAYDANSNRTQLSLNGATSATYQYDLLNRLTQLTDGASLNTTFGYDATNKLTSRTLPNGVVTTSQYEGLNRLTRLTHAKGANTLADFQYQLDAVNNITEMIGFASKVQPGGSAMPPDVRRWLCPADSSQIILGLCPWSGLSPSNLLGQSRTKGIAQKCKRHLYGGA
jgi:YD repeat-containing protein